MKFRYVVAYDLETTGFNPKRDEILEVGVAAWDVATDRTITVSSLFRPRYRIPDRITALTGISEQTLRAEGVGDLKETLAEFKELIANPELLLVGQNCRKFDNVFLRAKGVKIPASRNWDTMLQARADLRRRRLPTFVRTQDSATTYGSRLKTNLAYLAEYYRCAEPSGVHRAEADALLTLSVFKAQLERNKWAILAK